MHSWIHRNRVQLQLIFGVAPEPAAEPAPAPPPAAKPRRVWTPPALERRGGQVVLVPSPRQR